MCSSIAIRRRLARRGRTARQCGRERRTGGRAMWRKRILSRSGPERGIELGHVLALSAPGLRVVRDTPCGQQRGRTAHGAIANAKFATENRQDARQRLDDVVTEAPRPLVPQPPECVGTRRPQT